MLSEKAIHILVSFWIDVDQFKIKTKITKMEMFNVDVVKLAIANIDSST